MERDMETPDLPDGVVSFDNLLLESEERKKAFKSTEVLKEVDPIIDVGRLLLSDLQPVDITAIRKNLKASLDQLARDNSQILFNEIWKLPIERVEDAIVAKLPEPTTILPREKPIPKPKPPTKWEKFAKEKGINKKKRGRMVWDEQAKAWKPRYGYKRTDDDKSKWVLEVPGNADPYEDQFEKRVKEKKERVAKNELQRLRNIAKIEKEEKIGKEIDIAKISTASVGKFQPKLPKEKDGKKIGQKRKFEPVISSSSEEKKRALDVWDRLHKPPPVDITRAVNKYTSNLERSSSDKPDKKGRGGKGKKSSKKHGKPFQGKKSGKTSQGRKSRSFGTSKGRSGGKRK